MPRLDISDRLVHFTSGQSDEDAFGTLCRIVEARELRAGGELIRGRHRCVCFTEAPLLSQLRIPAGLNISSGSR